MARHTREAPAQYCASPFDASEWFEARFGRELVAKARAGALTNAPPRPSRVREWRSRAGGSPRSPWRQATDAYPLRLARGQKLGDVERAWEARYVFEFLRQLRARCEPATAALAAIALRVDEPCAERRQTGRDVRRESRQVVGRKEDGDTVTVTSRITVRAVPELVTKADVMEWRARREGWRQLIAKYG